MAEENTFLNANNIYEEVEDEVGQTLSLEEEQQLNQQDQCPPGQYFDEELGFCVVESEAEVVEEDPKKAKQEKGTNSGENKL